MVDFLNRICRKGAPKIDQAGPGIKRFLGPSGALSRTSSPAKDGFDARGYAFQKRFAVRAVGGFEDDQENVAP
jgi:hypothetical protein